MKIARLIVTASLVIGTTAVATTNFAEARRYRHADYVVSAGACVEPSAPLAYVYPAANWEPFFRRHEYRYGPILICNPSIQAAKVLSVRY